MLHFETYREIPAKHKATEIKQANQRIKDLLDR